MTGTSPGELKRSLTLVPTTAIVVGTIIGASIFVQPSEITALVPSLGGVAAIWFAAGVLTFLGALVCAELASAFSRTGGVYVFLNETYSPVVGFLWGWAMFWSMHSGILAAVAVVFARYVAFFVPLGDVGIQLVAAGAILVLSAINYRGVKHGSQLQTAFTIGKVAAIVLMITEGLAVAPGDSGGAALAAPQAVDGVAAEVSWTAIIQALIAGLFAFGGWHMVTYAAGETIDPTRTIPRALLIGTVIVTVCYVALNAVYMYVLPLDVVISSTRVAADAAEALVGNVGGGLMSGVGHLLNLWCLKWHYLGRPTCLLLDGTRWSTLPLGRPHAPNVPDSTSGDRAAGCLGCGPGIHWYLQSTLLPRHLCGVDLLRTDGTRLVHPAPTSRLSACLSRWRLCCHCCHFCLSIRGHCAESSDY